MRLTDRAMAGLQGALEGDPLVVADRFELHERIGEGGMATVHAALDRETGPPRAACPKRGSRVRRVGLGGSAREGYAPRATS